MRLARFSRPVMAALASLSLAVAGAVTTASAVAWETEREWSAEDEDNYSSWVAGLGTRAWPSADAMLASPQNSLRTADDAEIEFYADCGDLPYLLRAYFAYKNGLPFVVDFVEGERYGARPNRPAGKVDNMTFDGDAVAFFTGLPHLISTANYRTAPEEVRSFTYPIVIDRTHLRPGVVFYNPNGHVGVVTEVLDTGAIYLSDAHPDGTITRIRFGPKLAWRSASIAGGFRAYRPVRSHGRGRGPGADFVTDNTRAPGFSLEQYVFGDDYYLLVAASLTSGSLDPVADLASYIREDCYHELQDRVGSVASGWEVAKTTPIRIPRNIYFTEGPWENYSTPGRDIRLRASMLHVPRLVERYVDLYRRAPASLPGFKSEGQLVSRLLRVKEDLFQSLQVEYIRSDGKRETLTLAQIEQALFDLSFDPNHVPELRWGQPPAALPVGQELPARHYTNYREQQPWRNRLEPRPGRMAPDDPGNPTSPPDHDLSRQISELLRKIAPRPTVNSGQPH